MDRNELKVQALLEKISSLTSTYENQCAEYRVDLTLLSTELESANAELKALRNNGSEVGDVPKEAPAATSDEG